MPKIKEIQERLIKNADEYREIRLLTAKRTLSFFIMIYFMSFLFTIGGFSIGPLSLGVLAAITYHSFSILIIVIGWFLYEFSLYSAYIYTPGKMWPVIVVSAFAAIFVLGNLYAHLSSSF